MNHYQLTMESTDDIANLSLQLQNNQQSDPYYYEMVNLFISRVRNEQLSLTNKLIFISPLLCMIDINNWVFVPNIEVFKNDILTQINDYGDEDLELVYVDIFG